MSSINGKFSTSVDLLMLLSICFLQFTFVFGLPWLDIGLWPQVEGPTAFMHMICAFLLLLTGTQVSLREEKVMRVVSHPIVLLSWIFAFFTLAITPFMESPIRHIQGNMKYGIGVIWQFEFAVIVLAGASLWQKSAYKRTMSLSLWVSAAAVLSLYTFDTGFGTPFAFPEWTSIYCIAVSGITVTAFQDTSRTFKASAYIGSAVLLAWSLYVSENRTIVLAVFAVSIIAAAYRVELTKKLLDIPSVRFALIPLLSITMLGAIVTAGPLIESSAISKATEFRDTIPSENPLDHVAIHEGTLGTIWSRSYIVRIALADAWEKPETFLYGQGFGYLANVYERHARDIPGRRFANPTETSSLAFWDGHTSANFHSHNALTESIMSVGLIGAALSLALTALIAAASVPGLMIATAMTVVGSLWFPINYTIVSLALLPAMCVTPRTTSNKVSSFASNIAPLFAILGSCVIAFVGTDAFMLARAERIERAFLPVDLNSNNETCGFITARNFPETEIAVDLYTILKNRIMKAKNPPSEAFERTTNLVSINCALDKFIVAGDIRSLTSSLETRTYIASLGPGAFGGVGKQLGRWGDDLLLLLKVAPKRTEFVAPYIAILSGRSTDAAKREIERLLPLLSDSDPVRHYVLSVKARLNGDGLTYSAEYDKAMKLGLGNLWPMPSHASPMKGSQ